MKPTVAVLSAAVTCAVTAGLLVVPAAHATATSPTSAAAAGSTPPPDFNEQVTFLPYGPSAARTGGLASAASAYRGLLVTPAYVTPPSSARDAGAESWVHSRPYIDESATGRGLGSSALWDSGRAQGYGTTVAVLDTGVIAHPEFADQLLSGFDFVTDRDMANDGDGWDADATDPGDYTDGNARLNCEASNSTWHGTGVTSIIASRLGGEPVAGVAPQARVVPVRVMGACGGSLADVAAGIRWAAGLPVKGAPVNEHPADVINMSLTGIGPCFPWLQDAIDDARKTGAIVVAAAGNMTYDLQFFTPANCSGVVAVVAGTERGGRALFSNYAPETWTGDVVTAAGLDVPAMSPSAARDYDGAWRARNWDGTSMAAPIAAGVLAVLTSQGAKDPVTLMLATATAAANERDAEDPTGWSYPCEGKACGVGFVNLAAAMHALNPLPGVPDSLVADVSRVDAGAGLVDVSWDPASSTPETRYALYVPAVNVWEFSPTPKFRVASDIVFTPMQLEPVTGRWVAVDGGGYVPPVPEVEARLDLHVQPHARTPRKLSVMVRNTAPVSGSVVVRFKRDSSKWRTAKDVRVSEGHAWVVVPKGKRQVRVSVAWDGLRASYTWRP